MDLFSGPHPELIRIFDFTSKDASRPLFDLYFLNEWKKNAPKTIIGGGAPIREYILDKDDPLSAPRFRTIDEPTHRQGAKWGGRRWPPPKGYSIKESGRTPSARGV